MVAYFRPPEGPPALLERRSRALKWGILHSEFVHRLPRRIEKVPFPLFTPWQCFFHPGQHTRLRLKNAELSQSRRRDSDTGCVAVSPGELRP